MEKHLPIATIRKLYREMVRIRLTEELLGEKVLAGEVKTPCHLCIGQEAVAVGICSALKKTDYVFGNHRSHGHYLAKGGNLKTLLAEIYGKAAGCSKGRGGSMHIIDTRAGFMGAQPLVAGTISIATGAALASQIKREKWIVVSFFGDGAVEEGVFHEALNFAALKKLPIIYVCENNLYSSHLHIKERRRLNNIYAHGRLHNVKSMRVDGQDVIKIFCLIKKILPEIRNGNGPILIEAMTYRFRGHVGAIDNIGDQHTKDIRNPKEIAKWMKKDPLDMLKRHIIMNNLLSQSTVQILRKKIEREVQEAYLFAKKAPYPSPKKLASYVTKP